MDLYWVQFPHIDFKTIKQKVCNCMLWLNFRKIFLFSFRTTEPVSKSDIFKCKMFGWQRNCNAVLYFRFFVFFASHKCPNGVQQTRNVDEFKKISIFDWFATTLLDTADLQFAERRRLHFIACCCHSLLWFVYFECIVCVNCWRIDWLRIWSDWLRALSVCAVCWRVRMLRVASIQCWDLVRHPNSELDDPHATRSNLELMWSAVAQVFRAEFEYYSLRYRAFLPEIRWHRRRGPLAVERTCDDSFFSVSIVWRCWDWDWCWCCLWVSFRWIWSISQLQRFWDPVSLALPPPILLSLSRFCSRWHSTKTMMASDRFRRNSCLRRTNQSLPFC